MNVKRGDVVLVDFPFPQGTGSKVRPALVIQNNPDNARMANTILAQVTGNVQRAGEPTQVLIDIATADRKQSGLQFDSVVNCINLVAIDRSLVLRRLGSLPLPLLDAVGDALKVALELA
jgi:mRNA interferase MazF